MSALRQQRILPYVKRNGELTMRIYYLIAVVANVIAAVAFHKNINISVLSILPLVFIALMLFQAALFKKVKTENGFRTAYGSPFTAE